MTLLEIEALERDLLSRLATVKDDKDRLTNIELSLRQVQIAKRRVRARERQKQLQNQRRNQQ